MMVMHHCIKSPTLQRYCFLPLSRRLSSAISPTLHHKTSPSQPSNLCTGNMFQTRHFSDNVFLTFYKEMYSVAFAPDCLHMEVLTGLFEKAHTLTGAPWWLTIVGTGFLLRSVVYLPFHIVQVNNMKKKALFAATFYKSELDFEKDKETYREREDLTRFKKAKLIHKRKEKWKESAQDIYINYSFHPYKDSVAMIIQMPLWITVSYALRNMSGIGLYKEYSTSLMFPGLLSGGFPWALDLTLPDPFMILPFIMLTGHVVNCELGYLQNDRVNTSIRVIRFISLGLSGFMFCVSLQMPLAMSLYWALSAWHQVGTHLMLKSPVLQNKLGILRFQDETSSPYSSLLHNAKHRYLFLKPFTRKMVEEK